MSEAMTDGPTRKLGDIAVMGALSLHPPDWWPDGSGDSFRETISGIHLVVVGTPCRNCGGGPLNHPMHEPPTPQGRWYWCDCSRCPVYEPVTMPVCRVCGTTSRNPIHQGPSNIGRHEFRRA